MTETVLPAEMLKLLDPAHITPLVAYLAHESNEHTGSCFEVGGGWYSQVLYVYILNTRCIQSLAMFHSYNANFFYLLVYLFLYFAYLLFILFIMMGRVFIHRCDSSVPKALV